MDHTRQLESADRDFVAEHPWLSMSAAAATGAILGAAIPRLPDDLRARTAGAVGTIATMAASAATRYGLAAGVRRLGSLVGTTANTKGNQMNDNGNGTTSTSTVENVKGQLSDLASRAGDVVDDATTKIGEGVQKATDRVADAGRYLEDTTPSKLGSDITDLIRRHPKKSMALGIGLGILVSRLLSR